MVVQRTGPSDGADTSTATAVSVAAADNAEAQGLWCDVFTALGGFTHLQRLLLGMDVAQAVKRPLHRTCLAMLLRLVNSFFVVRGWWWWWWWRVVLCGVCGPVWCVLCVCEGATLCTLHAGADALCGPSAAPPPRSLTRPTAARLVPRRALASLLTGQRW